MAGRYEPTIQKELRPIVKRLRKEGWQLVPTGGTHARLINPEGRTVLTLATSSCNYRAVKKALSVLRKEGVKI
jgi:predicted RNA binding protein YcfA (HicA-like mRNA interferase family)